MRGYHKERLRLTWCLVAQRPQVQERLTQQVLVALQTLLQTQDVAVTIDAVHYCVKARGVMDSNSHTKTTALGGQFRNDVRRLPGANQAIVDANMLL